MRFNHLRRRGFIALLGGMAAWPLTARAQQPEMPVVGFLHPATPGPYTHVVAAFRQGLKEADYSQGQNVVIEYRWAEGHYDQLHAMAADLVRRQVAVIAALGGTPTALAAKAATSIIPIVFDVGVDPVQSGLVASLNRPGGNVTGVAILSTELEAKRLELMHELVPTAGIVAVLVNPTNPIAEHEIRGMQDGARSLGLQLYVLNANNESDIDTGLATLVQHQARALVVADDGFFFGRRDQIVPLAAQHRMPDLCPGETAVIDGPRALAIFEIDHKLERGALLNWQMSGFGAPLEPFRPACPSGDTVSLRGFHSSSRRFRVRTLSEYFLEIDDVRCFVLGRLLCIVTFYLPFVCDGRMLD
jgi:putative ABC transport system substrate-binding protein